MANQFMDFLNNAGSAVKTGANDVLQSVLSEKLTPLLPNSPTIGQAGGNDFIKGLQDPAFQGKGNNLSKAGPLTMLGAMLGAYRGGENPAGDASMANQAVKDAGVLGKSPVRVVLKPSIYGAGREAAVQKTVDTLVPGATATEKYANLQPTMDTLGSQIKAKLQVKPTLTNASEVANDYNGSLDTLRTGKIIDTKTGKAEIANFINNLYRESPQVQADGTKLLPHAGAADIIDSNLQDIPATTKGTSINPSLSRSVVNAKGDLLPSQYGGFSMNPPSESPGAQFAVEGNGTTALNSAAENPTIGPTKLTGDDLYNMYKQANHYNAKALAKRAAGGQLSATEEVQLAGRDAIGNALAKANPDAKSLITQQSHLYDAADSLFKGREGEVAAANKAAATPPLPTDPNFAQRHWKFLTGLGIAGVPTLAGTGLIAKEILSNPDTQNTKFQPINTVVPDLTQIKDGSGSPLTLNIGNYNEQLASLKSQQQQLELGNRLGVPTAQAQYAAIGDQIDAISTKQKNTQNIIDAHTDTTNQIRGLNEAQSLLSKAPPEWYQVLGGRANPVTAIRTMLEPGFSAWQQNLKAISTKYGVDLSQVTNAGDAKAANAAIKSQVDFTLKNFNQAIIDNGGQLPSQTKQATGKDLINNLVQQAHGGVNTGNASLNAVLTPTATPPPTATPTLDPFQQQLQAPFQPGQM